jgi:hypothetical protein
MIVECPECGQDVSSSAAACPECAYPVATGTPTTPITAHRRQGVGGSAFDVTKQIVGRLLFGGALMAMGGAWDAPPVILSGLFVWGTGIPIWIRARRAERLGGGGEAARIENRLERRMEELHDRHVRQIADMEDQHARHLSEIEERLDFTERLLTKSREQIGP